MEVQRVVVIQDASKEACSSAIRWALHALFLKPGDLLVLLGVLHDKNNPSRLSFKGTRKLLGYRAKVDSSSKFGSNHRIVGREAARKEAYESNAEIMDLSKLYKAEKVEFRIEVSAGASPAVVALKSAEDLKATWVILDRKMKKNKKIFLEKLSCGISRMKRNNRIELLRGPKEKFNEFSVIYDDMMSGAPEEEDLFSIELFPRYCFTEKMGCNSYNIDNYAVGQAEANQVSQNQKLTHTSSSADSIIGLQAEETFRSPACTICDNRRQNMELRKGFTYVELHAATDGFSSKNNLSKGGAQCAFRGQLENKLNIVIKPANNNIYFQEPIKFKSEIDTLSRVRHNNLVMLLGCCAEGSHRLLVYEYVCNGSLNQHLSTEYHPMPLTWTERLRVALGASRGLNHLHENNIIHRDIRSSNILLNHDSEPLLGDLGLATMQSDKHLKQENIQTSYYLAPEFLENGTMSTQTDVYSYGVVLLELITGQRTMDKKLGQKGFLTWARALLKQRRYLELLDPRIANSHDVYQLYRMAQLAQKCISKNPKKRLPMDEVNVRALQAKSNYRNCKAILNLIRTIIRKDDKYSQFSDRLNLILKLGFNKRDHKTSCLGGHLPIIKPNTRMFMCLYMVD
ncbi:probable serine/threonine-protein kinase PBL10 [Herrania umbratica]|uniref:Probable serine/threonine-protein kinase PBL10 n=1 Tax=Herrania umbratica TaxID=108875 RepID=A0A6J0ZSI6_9ROSI|nr:probable serine/threonine-protein kinase PBL10 [Herrania umbratica]